MASLGDLVVNIKANTAQFRRGMNKSKGDVQRFAFVARTVLSGALTAGLAATALGVATIKANLASLDQVAKTSAKLGLLPEKLAGLQIAFERTGVPIASGTMALQRMTRRLSEAAQGSGTAVKALRELGLSASDLVRLSPDQQLGRIADAMKNVTSQSDKVRLAFALFDSEGVGLVNTLKDGSAGLAAFQKEAERSGLAFSTDELERIEEANNAIGNLNSKFSALGATLTVEATPAISEFADSLGDVLKVYRTIKGDDISEVENMFGFGKSLKNALGGGGLQGGLDNILAAGKAKRDKKEAAERAAEQAAKDGKQITTRHFLTGFMQSKKMIQVQQDLLKVKLAIIAADEKKKTTAEAQQGLDEMRAGEAIEAARARVSEAKKGTRGPQAAGVAQRGSVQAMQAIFRSQSPGKAQLTEQKKANAILQQLLDEQRADKVAEFTAEGAV